MKGQSLKYSILFYLFMLPLALAATGIEEFSDASMGHEGTTELIVVHTNDTHGHPLKFYHFPTPNVGGIPARATLVDRIRTENDHVLVLDAGDLNTGRPESNYFKAIPDIIGFNYIGVDAMVLGNHEFDHPLHILGKQQRIANFPFISANVYDEEGELIAAPYIIKDMDGLRVGIFGLTPKETEITGNPVHVASLVFEDEVIAARRVVKELSKKTDIIIALVHLGFYGEHEHNTLGSRRLAEEVEGIDLIVDGHSHTDMPEPFFVKGTPIVQAWMWGLRVGLARLLVEDGEVTEFSWESIPVNLQKTVVRDDGSEEEVYEGGEKIEEDEFIREVLQPYANEVENLLSEVIGHSDQVLLNDEIRLKETALGNLVADSMLWYTSHLNPDLAIQNGGGVRSTISPGDISKKVVHEVLPFDNSIVVLRLSGAELLELFNFFPSIERGKGGFPQFSKGVSLEIDFTEGVVRNVLIGGRAVDPEKTYVVATNSYLAAGGDGYKQLANAEYRFDTSVFQREAFIEYVQHLGGTITPLVEGRISVIE